jgi:hypothetical protein
MRLIDRESGHEFRLPPDNVVILVPRAPAPLPPPPVREVVRRSLTVHDRRGATARWDLTARGWRRRV